MAEPVNLNKFRKARKRAAERKEAAENRVSFGRSRAEREKQRGEADKAARDLEGKKLD